MKLFPEHRTRRGLLPLAAIACLLLAYGPAQARGKAKINYIPGITLVPDVLLSDSQTPRYYNVSPGTTLWKDGLPIQQGDKMKLNVFVATGGADLKEIRVKLDNNSIADITATPWNTTIDTASLSTGYHMLEVWTQATGDPPQSSTKQLSFYIVKQLPAQYRVMGIQEEHSNGQTTEVPPSVDPNAPPPLPAFLAGKSMDAGAVVALRSRSASLPASSPSAPVGAGPVTIQEPTVFIVRTPSGSAATQYVYALVRDGQTILTSNAPFSLVDPNRITVIKIQGRTDTQAGLRSGPVTLWVWGIDAQGQPGDPSKVQLQIP